MREVGTRLLLGAALRRILAPLTPAEVETFLGLFSLDAVRAVTAEKGDIDFPTQLFSHLFRPHVAWRGLRAVPARLWPRLAWLLARWYVATARGR